MNPGLMSENQPQQPVPDAEPASSQAQPEATQALPPSPQAPPQPDGQATAEDEPQPQLAQAGAAAQPHPQVAAQQPERRPFFARTWVLVVGGILACLVIFGAGFGAGWAASPGSGGDEWGGHGGMSDWGGRSDDGTTSQRPGHDDDAAPAPEQSTSPSPNASDAGL